MSMSEERVCKASLEELVRQIGEGADLDLLIPVCEKKLARTYPRRVKEKAVVYTPERMRIIRENIRKYAWARKTSQETLGKAKEITRVPIETLLSEIPSPNLQRGWNNYCPHCGWWGHGIDGGVIDIVKHPWEIVCPQCKKHAPGFDARAYFLSGKDERGWFREDKADKSLLPIKGKFCSVALDAVKSYCFHYWWFGFSQTLQVLADAYVYTGDIRYARYTLGLLTHFAYFHPYFLRKDCVNGDTHGGGVLVMDCYEAMIMRYVALSYDKIFTVIHDADSLALISKVMNPYDIHFSQAHDIKRYIEGRIFKVISRDMKSVWFGDSGRTHYRTHVAYETIAVILGDSPLAEKFNREAWRLRFQGFGKDGSADVGGICYDLGAYRQIKDQYFDIMKYQRGARFDYARDKSIQAAGHLYFDLYCLGKYYPHYGDGGHCGEPAAGPHQPDCGNFIADWGQLRSEKNKAACEYAQLFRDCGIKRFALIAWYLNGKKTKGIHLSMLERNPENVQSAIQSVVDKTKMPVEKSFMARDLGISILKSGNDQNSRALWMRASNRNQTNEMGWHGHADSMNLGLFGYGLDLMPDIGYMDQKHWIFGHNTVSRQETPLPHTGKRLPVGGGKDETLPKPILSKPGFIAEFPGVQVIRSVGIEHKDSMRTSFLVDVDAENYYIVDHFRVSASVPEKYVTYSFHSYQGKVSTSLTFKKNSVNLEGVSRMGGKWLPPTFTSTQKEASNSWWAEITLEDTYRVLDSPCNVKLRFTSLRPADHVFHTFYMPQQKRLGNPTNIPYFFISLAMPKDKNMPRQFASIIEPYRKTRSVKSAMVIETNQAGVEIIEVKEVSGRILTFVISDQARKVNLADGTVLKSDIAVIVKDGKKESVYRHRWL